MNEQMNERNLDIFFLPINDDAHTNQNEDLKLFWLILFHFDKSDHIPWTWKQYAQDIKQKKYSKQNKNPMIQL